MATIHFVTHPEIVVDPSVPVPQWRLSPEGERRMNVAAGRGWAAGVRTVIGSAERKAMDAAGILAGRLGLAYSVLDGLGENDRSATGYLPKAEFESMADAFFARPSESVRGWERAVDARGRIVAAVARATRLAAGDGDIAIVSHGAVGALLLCHLKGVPINRREDQPGGGGGNLFSFTRDGTTLLRGWRPIDAPDFPVS